MWKLISNPSASAYFVFSSWEPLGILISVMAYYSLSKKNFYFHFGKTTLEMMCCEVRIQGWCGVVAARRRRPPDQGEARGSHVRRRHVEVLLVDVAVHHLDHDLDHRLPGSPSTLWWTTASVGISALDSRWTNFLKNQTKQLFLLQIKVMVGALLVFMAAVAIYFLCTSEVEA